MTGLLLNICFTKLKIYVSIIFSTTFLISNLLWWTMMRWHIVLIGSISLNLNCLGSAMLLS